MHLARRVLILGLSEMHTSRSSLDNPRIVQTILHVDSVCKVESEVCETILALSEFDAAWHPNKRSRIVIVVQSYFLRTNTVL